MRRSIVALAATVLSAADPAAFETRKAHVRGLLDQQAFAPALEQAKALNRDWPDDLAGYQLLGSAHLGLGNYADAERAIQWMLDLRIGKADSAGWLLVGRFREITGDIEGAIDAVNLAAGRLSSGEEGGRPALVGHVARLHFLAGRMELAERAAQDALSGSPADLTALDTLVRVRLAQRRRTEAIEFIRRMVSVSSHPRYLYLMAETTGNRVDYATFEREARQRVASSVNANRELTLYYAGPGKRPAEAVEIARRESTLRHDVFTMDALAVALFASGKAAEARTVMNDVLAVGTRDPEILKHAIRMGVKPR